jgi:phospholipid/cholesterol/gamma-HCH transport system ATP-binding protein
MSVAAPASDAVIRVRGIVNRFGAQVVHDGLDLEVRRGEVFGIVGGSGSGKSVLLRTMLGLQRAESGSVEIEGRDITQATAAELLAVKRRYGVTFQHGALFTSLTVAENVTLPIAEYHDLDDEVLAGLADLKIRMVGLPAEAGAKYPAQLSGGMIKRAALARALALDPSLLFLDEPTSGLDPISAAAFDRLVLYLQQHLRLTIVMITHDLDTIFRVCNRVGVIVDRRMISGTLEEIVRHDHPWIREYFHGERSRVDGAEGSDRGHG